jgi:hypothetical protein
MQVEVDYQSNIRLRLSRSDFRAGDDSTRHDDRHCQDDQE